jgi:3-methyladenine DNA glycosylase/8-oxoguanine DNA glycosylase
VATLATGKVHFDKTLMVHMDAPVALEYKFVKNIEPTAPFNFDATFHKPDHFPSGDNEWQPGRRWQSMLWQDQPLGLLFEDRGSIHSPLIQLSIFAQNELDDPFLEGLLEEVNYRYNLQMDLDEFNHQFLDDPQLGGVIQKWSGMRPMHYGSLYEYLNIAIVLQNATVRRSVNMLQALFERYGSRLAFDNQVLYCYWLPQKIYRTSEQDLRDLKVGYRAKSIKRVTDAFVHNEIDEFSLRGKSVDEQRRELLNLYGVGPASVGYLLFDVFHRWDYLSYISPWEQAIYSRLFFNTDIDDPVGTGALIDYFTQHYRGYRMLAVHYFWEDLFWKRKNEKIEWLEKLIRL